MLAAPWCCGNRIARLIEPFALERELPINGYGSTTFKRSLEERGVEPDECYFVGRDLGDEDEDAPDIALEVVITSGGISTLEVYRGLGVREVWYWYRGQFQIDVLTEGAYVRQPRSTLVPGLDFEELATYAERSDQFEALKAYRAALRGE